MTLSGEVDNAVKAVFVEEFVNEIGIHDVAAYEQVIVGVHDVFEVCQITRIGQLVEVNDSVIGILPDQQPNQVGTDETGTSGDQNVSFKIHEVVFWCLYPTFFPINSPSISN